MIWMLLAAALFGWAWPAQASRVKPDDALRVLSASRPDVVWDAKSALTGDFDCDGSADVAFLGKAARKVYVGVVRAAAAQPEIIAFDIDAHTQPAICDGPLKLATESLDYDPTNEAGKLDGFLRSRRCKGLVLSGGECDPFHLFWNHKTNHLDWWRH